MTHKSVLLNEVAEFFRVNSASCGDNSVLGMQFRTCENFGESTDFSLVLSPKFSQIQKPHRNHFRCDSARSAESSEKNKSKKHIKSFCYFWLSPKVESSLPLNPNLPNNANSAKSQNLSENQAKNAESANKSQQTIEEIAVEVAEFLGDFECKARLKSAQCSKSPKSPQDAPKTKLQTQYEFANPILIDATLGLGGHSERLLDENPTLKIIGIDKDKSSLDFAKKRLARFGTRFSAVQGSFAKQIKQILRTHKNIYGILADLGISSPQVDNLERGFSFESPLLDMRMDVDASLDAKFILNNYSKDDLARIFREFGEIRGAEKIANLIAESRRKSPIKSGEDLCKIVEKHAKWKDGIHPATLIFQAIRMEVNNELGDLGEFLENIAHLKGTKVAIISFHSLEDRLVKRAFKAWSAACVCDEDAMKCECGGKNERGKILTKKPIIPSGREISQNKRARSAKMRCFKFYE